MQQHNFIKNGNEVKFKQNKPGEEYSLENGKVYKINFNGYGEVYLDIMPNLIMPKKLYISEQKNKFVQKILNQYKTQDSGVLGVMLSGLKGSGKTVTAKQIAMESNLPIILIDKYIHTRYFKDAVRLLANIPVCIIFDEIDKMGGIANMEDMLSIMDGTDTFGKILFILTCNNERKIDENMKDRCSRIRYWKKFEETPKEVTEEIIKDRLDNKELIETVKNFIEKNFNNSIFDNICAFIDEINLNPNSSLEELFEDMNISSKE